MELCSTLSAKTNVGNLLFFNSAKRFAYIYELAIGVLDQVCIENKVKECLHTDYAPENFITHNVLPLSEKEEVHVYNSKTLWGHNQCQ